MWQYNYLVHYGVLGMKWGVRRTKEELQYSKGSIYSITNKRLKNPIKTSNGVLVRQFSDHAARQAANRKITAKNIIDAVQNPLYIKPVKFDSNNRPSQNYIGKSATVAVNPESGVISTVWETGSKTRARFKKG